MVVRLVRLRASYDTKVQPSIKTKVISAQYSTERDSSLNVFLIVCHSETRFAVDQQMPLLHVSAGEVTNC